MAWGHSDKFIVKVGGASSKCHRSWNGENMPELVIKTAKENGDLLKKYSKKELKKMSRVLKPLENILNEHYAKHIMSKYGDIAKKE